MKNIGINKCNAKILLVSCKDPDISCVSRTVKGMRTLFMWVALSHVNPESTLLQLDMIND